MLPDTTLPVPISLVNLLGVMFPLFTAPSFRTFCGLACGFLAQTGKRTVCGIADRGGPSAGVATRPGAVVLLSRPLEPR
jgi:hypothetical protein